MVGKYEAATRFVADDSLSILKIHSVGLVTIINPVHLSLQNKFAVLGVKLQTKKLLKV